MVVFLSAEYAARDWTRPERRAALARAVRERREYVLPARFDDTLLPGLLSDIATVGRQIMLLATGSSRTGEPTATYAATGLLRRTLAGGGPSLLIKRVPAEAWMTPYPRGPNPCGPG